MVPKKGKAVSSNGQDYQHERSRVSKQLVQPYIEKRLTAITYSQEAAF